MVEIMSRKRKFAVQEGNGGGGGGGGEIEQEKKICGTRGRSDFF